MYELVITGRIAGPAGVRNASIAVNGGKIAKVGSGLRGKRNISFDDSCLIFPGFIDLHVHAREDQSHQWDYKEDYKSAGEAAINGGVTAFMDRPNTPFPATTKRDVAEKHRLARKCKVDVYQCAGIGESTDPIPGQKFYKIFLAESNSQLYFRDMRRLENQVKRYRKAQMSVHCELDSIVSSSPDRPPEAEVAAIERVIGLARKYRAAVNICHLSTKDGMKLVEAAKKNGVRVTCEVTPHHLFFDKGNVKNFQRSSLIKMNPPLRSLLDRKYLLGALKRGSIDFLASDHAPHTMEEKQGTNPSGVPHLDTYGHFVTWLLRQGVSPRRISETCAINPARFLGIRRGMAAGDQASLTVLDLKRKTTVRSRDLKTKCRWSPFEGVTFPGAVRSTIVNGKIYS